MKKQINIEDNGRAKIVRAYRGGRCYAVAFARDTEDEYILALVAMRVVRYAPYNETTGEFIR